MTRAAETAAVCRIVRVETFSLELTPRLGPVVRLGRRPAPAADTNRIPIEHASPEPVPVLGAIAATAGAATPLLCCAPVFVTAPLRRVLGAAWLAAHTQSTPPAAHTRMALMVSSAWATSTRRVVP